MENRGQHYSASGIPVKDLYTPEDTKGLDYERDLGVPGEPPFTRGVYRNMYRGQFWTIRRLTGNSTPEATNQLYREQYEVGQTGFSMANDISTPIALDPDDPRIINDVGVSGPPIHSLEDMETCFDGLPIDKVSTYLADKHGMQAAMYFVMAEKRGLDLARLMGTTANCMLAWTSCNFPRQVPPDAFLRYAVDHVEWCTQHTPRWHPVCYDSYNHRDMGVTAYQEIGMLFATALAYIEEEKRRGRVPLDRFVRRMSFNTAVHNDIFEEVAKLRACRRIWYKIIKDRYGIDDPACAQFRVHVQTSGSTHTRQEPYNNLIRIAYQCLAGVLGGAQSIHANGYDEGVCLPTDQAMLLSIRTEQILQYETNVINTMDPLGGSWYVEKLTDEVEGRTWDYIKKIEDMGGMAKATQNGFIFNECKQALFERAEKWESGETPIIGLNTFRLDEEPYKVPIYRPDPNTGEIQADRVRKLRERRDNARVAEALRRYEEDSLSGENTNPALMEAVRAYATLQEIVDVQLKVYGEWPFPISL